jgi:hypothetical protein
MNKWMKNTQMHIEWPQTVVNELETVHIFQAHEGMNNW